MTWLLVTYLLSSGCHADGPTPWWMNADNGRSFCQTREIVGIDSQRFRTEDACQTEARRRWSESGYSTASRCTRTR